MGLQQRLDTIRRGLEKKAPADVVALLHRVTDELRNTGIADRALGEGQTAPPFELEDARGGRVSLVSLLERGPLVLTFFRGHW